MSHFYLRLAHKFNEYYIQSTHSYTAIYPIFYSNQIKSIIFAELAKRNNYEKDMYDEKRRKGELAAATEAGIAQGIEQGIELMAKNMLAAGFPHDQIAQLTGLDSDTIQSLASTISDIS